MLSSMYLHVRHSQRCSVVKHDMQVVCVPWLLAEGAGSSRYKFATPDQEARAKHKSTKTRGLKEAGKQV